MTQLLSHYLSQDQELASEVTAAIYQELRQLAAQQLRGERPNHTLQATALANEAFMVLQKRGLAGIESRVQFLRVAAKAMRLLLIDHARKRQAMKRRSRLGRVTLSEVAAVFDQQETNILDLHEVLEKLSSMDERKAKIVELRFFAGSSIEETAAALDVSCATVERDWRFAKAWLAAELRRISEG